MHTRGSPGVSWAAEDQCGGGGGECDGTGDAMLGGWFFFPSSFCFTFLTLHSLKTVFEVPQSQRANLVPHHGMLVNLLVLLNASFSILHNLEPDTDSRERSASLQRLRKEPGDNLLGWFLPLT